jgi:regulator of nonsense transcripts 1
MEADYDRAMKESQSRDNISLRWDWGLNHKRVAYFYFQRDDTELRLVPGDELKLCHRAAGARGAWEGSGCVLRFDQSEEVCLEMNNNVSACDQLLCQAADTVSSMLYACELEHVPQRCMWSE